MPRTLVNLDTEDKRWLDERARARHVSMAQVVREAVHEYRLREEMANRPTLEQALRETSGVWNAGDGLAWQQRLRDEWSERS